MFDNKEINLDETPLFEQPIDDKIIETDETTLMDINIGKSTPINWLSSIPAVDHDPLFAKTSIEINEQGYNSEGEKE